MKVDIRSLQKLFGNNVWYEIPVFQSTCGMKRNSGSRFGKTYNTLRSVGWKTTKPERLCLETRATFLVQSFQQKPRGILNPGRLLMGNSG